MKPVQPSKPHALLVIGMPASGKSAFARAFAETFHAPFLDADTIARHARSDSDATALIDNFLGELTRTGQTFLYEPINGSRAFRTEFGKWARAHDYEPLIVWVQVDAKTAETRARRQGFDIDEFAIRSRQFTPPSDREKLVVISGKHTAASQRKTILTHLSAGRADRPVAVPPRGNGPILRMG